MIMNITNKNIDDFVKKAVKAASLEKPGDEFIPSLMSKIEALNTADNKLTIASPIISRKGWVTIGIIIIVIFSLLLSLDSSTISFSIIQPYFNRFTLIPFSINVSGTFLIGIFTFVFFFIVQISLSVNRLNEKGNV